METGGQILQRWERENASKSRGGGPSFSRVSQWGVFGDFLPGTTRDYVSEAGDLWRNPVALACVKWFTRAFQEAPLLELDANGDEVRGSRFMEMWAEPNETYVGTTMEAGLLFDFIFHGNAFLLDEGRRLWWLPAVNVAPHLDDRGHLIGYRYGAGTTQTIYSPTDILHLRDGLDPRNPTWGLSRMSAAAREVVTDNEASSYHAAVVRNASTPGGIVWLDEQLDAQTERQIREVIKRRTSDEERGNLLVLGVKGRYERTAFTPEDVALDKVRFQSVNLICASIGVDAMVIGLPSTQRTYSNYSEAVRAAYRSGVIPTGKNMARQYTAWARRRKLIPNEHVLQYDLQQVEALKDPAIPAPNKRGGSSGQMTLDLVEEPGGGVAA